MSLRFTTLFGIVISIVTGVAVGILGYHNRADSGVTARRGNVIEQAADYIQSNYVEEIPDGQLVNDALKGMLSGLDDHSRFLDPDDFARLQAETAGLFGGIGVYVGLADGFFTITEVIDDTPAAHAHLASGDRLTALNDESLKGKKLGEVADLLRGPQGTDIRLTLIRSGEKLEVTLTRAKIEVQSVHSRWLEPGYAYARITQFQKGTGNDFADAIMELESDGGIQGLILDLRDNPGGVLGASVDVADTLLAPGLLICTEGRPGGRRLEHRASTADLLRGAPVVMLINAGTASGAEIVTSALKDHGRATIVGSKSYGKGSVQSLLAVGDDRALKLTTGYYFRPRGDSLQAKGVVPDVALQSSPDTTALPRALAVLKGITPDSASTVQQRLPSGEVEGSGVYGSAGDGT